MTHDILSHIIFEENADGDLVSHHIRIPVSIIAPGKKVVASNPDTKYFANGQPDFSSRPGAIVRSGNGFTFTYLSHSEKLIAGWGPDFHIYPLYSNHVPGIFVNSMAYYHFRKHGLNGIPHALAYRVSRIFTNSSANRQQHALFVTDSAAVSPRSHFLSPATNETVNPTISSANVAKCSDREELEFEMVIAYDASFCKRYQGSFLQTETVIRAMVDEIAKEFRQKTCIVLKVRGIDAYCDEKLDNFFRKPKKLKRCQRRSKPMCRSSTMLEHISNTWKETISDQANRDGVFFLSGYEDDTDVSGATYKSAACDSTYSFAWVEQTFPIIFAHEVGHMLGATHQSEGIMRSEVRAEDPIELSPDSVREIEKFVEQDPRSWCLRRNYREFPAIQRDYSWNSPIALMEDRGNDDRVDDISFANLSGNGLADLMILYSREVPGGVSLSVSTVRDVACEKKGACSHTIIPDRMAFPRIFNKSVTGYSLSAANIRDADWRDMIISHIEEGVEEYTAYYQVGYEMNATTGIPATWSPQHVIPPFSAQNVQCSGITFGSVRSPGSKDLVFVYIDKRKGATGLQYIIGFDVDASGAVTGGWSNPIDVFGWYGDEPTGVSVSLYDIDGNGMPELILYHMDNSDYTRNGFFRFGRDMDKDGNITKGLSNFVRVPKLLELRAELAGAMAVSDLGTGTPTMAVVQREAKLSTPADVWSLNFATNAVVQSILDTSIERKRRSDLSHGCIDCYDSVQAAKCTKDQRLCPSTIDEVILNTDPSQSDMDMTSISSRMRRRSEPSEPIHDSIFCVGFHYLYKNNEGCDVFDESVVYSKGVEQVFLRELGALVPLAEDDYDSTTLFESPSGGTNGVELEPGAARITIFSKKARRREILRRAVANLEKVIHFKTVFDSHTLTRGKDGRTYIVTINFNKKWCRQAFGISKC